MEKSLLSKLMIFEKRKNRPTTKILSIIEQTHKPPLTSEYLTAYKKRYNGITIIYDTADTLTERQKEFLINCYHDRLESGQIHHYMKEDEE